MSSETGALFPALIGLSADLKNSKKLADNPFFNSKYANLETILDDVKPELLKHGFIVIQEATGDGNNIKVSTMIIHSSGQWLQDEGLTIPLNKKDAQGACSAVTYARRYDLQAILNLASEDDDGNDASKKDDKKKPDNKPVEKPKGNIINFKTVLDKCGDMKEWNRIKSVLTKSSWTVDEIKIIDEEMLKVKGFIETAEEVK
jgi:hypothetical protein